MSESEAEDDFIRLNCSDEDFKQLILPSIFCYMPSFPPLFLSKNAIFIALSVFVFALYK